MHRTLDSRTTRTESLTKKDKFIVEATLQFNTQGYYDTLVLAKQALVTTSNQKKGCSLPPITMPVISLKLN